MAEKNFCYYEPRCAHGSSLGTGMHALVAARLGDAAMALHYLRATAASDLDFDPNSAGGVRIAGLGAVASGDTRLRRLRPEGRHAWRRPEASAAVAQPDAGVEYLRPAPNDLLQRWPVSKRVNSSKADADDPTLIEAVRAIAQ
jgi:hypothetical protein